LFEEGREHRNEYVSAEQFRNRDADGADDALFRVAHHTVGILEVLHAVPALVVELDAFLRELHLSRIAMEEPHAHPVLKLTDLGADGLWRYAHRPGGAREIPGFRRLDENPDGAHLIEKGESHGCPRHSIYNLYFNLKQPKYRYEIWGIL